MLQGLIHISELSWNKIFIPEAVVKVGDFVRCKVLSVNKQKGQISLSLKVYFQDFLSFFLSSGQSTYLVPAG